ncbi:hypothetical protein [Rhodococcus koreensis]|uniref:Uncharacterized protein n=1 Tax=Rhodococcus koreensis TaxID=99653 RepID=A0A1H4L2N7_9NOCA|nr:hypothetical protein [Rhodococcus koreensis]SEB65030.1 hypothetical protein SAMN04490239_1058 [Rhodococcus koreensis]
MPEDIDASGFNGKWRMDLDRSKIWDAARGEWAPEVLADQRLEIRTEGDVMYYKISVGISSDLTVHSTYTCRFGDSKWAPYMVESIDGDANHEKLTPNDLPKSGMKLGEASAYVKQVYVDPRTQYRITKNPDGTAQYVMLRRLSADGRTNTGYVLDTNGVATIAKVFVRES